MKKIIVLMFVAFLGINLQAKNILKTYNFKDSTGKSIELQTMDSGIYSPTYKGKVVLLAFFGKNCPPCRAEIPGFVKLQNELQKKFQIIAVHVQQKMAQPEIENFIASHNINYPVIPATKEAFDLANFVSSKTGWRGQIPYSILLDKNGEASKTYLGMQSEKRLTKDIKALF
ncbi:MAG: TlpA disulfide reductase family protein [Sulfurospirillum sp.]